MSASTLRVGQRVRIPNGYEAYIRFLGRTLFKEGEWVGLELDEPIGKNNGTVDGTPYFECPENHGMFMRPLPTIEVLEEPTPVVKPARSTPVPRPASTSLSARGAVVSARTPTNGLARQPGSSAAGASATARPRPSLAASTTKRTSLAPSAASSSSTNATRRLSNTPQAASVNARVSRLSNASSRSASPQKPTILRPSTTGQSSSRVSLAGSRASARSPAEGSSASPSIDRVLSPASSKSAAEQRRTPSLSMPPPPRAAPNTTSSTLQHNKQIDELQTKLQFLEKKRQEDKDRLRKLPDLEERASRYELVIQKLQAKCQSLASDNGVFKKSDAELKDALDKLERAQAEHESILELATIDREMAEETAESLRAETAALRSKAEELQLENEILLAENAEFSEDMTAEEKASQGWLHLQRENERLKDALFRLRDLSQEQEEVLREEIKQLEDDTRELQVLRGEHEDGKNRLEELASDGELLREQLEAAMASESMIEQLSERNMALSDQLDELRKVNEDLREDKELSDELEINHLEHEKQLQEVIDFNEALLADATRKLARERDDVADREYTIARFRELVSTLQGDMEELRQSKEVSEREAASLENSSRRILDLNRQLQTSASRGTVKIVDMELRKLDANQALDQLAVTRLLAPDAFKSVEQGSLSAYLRFKRIRVKASLLRGFVKQRVENNDSTGSNVFVKCEALDKLLWMAAMAERFVACIEGSSLEQFAKFEQTDLEMESVERHLSSFIEGLRRNDFHESLVVDGLNKSIAVMRHVGEVYLGGSPDAFAEEAIMRASLVQGSLENTITIVAATKDAVRQAVVYPVADGEDAPETDDNLLLFERNAEATMSASRSAKVIAGKLLQILKDMKTRSLSLNLEYVPKLNRLQDATNSVFDQFHATGIAVHGYISRQHEVTDADEISFSELSSAIERSTLDSQSADIFSRPLRNLRAISNALGELVDAAGDFAQLIEFEKNQPPWVMRGKQLETNKVLSVAAEDEIKLLKRDLGERATLLKVKQKEMEEIKMKVDMLEKRHKEAASKVQRLNDLERAIEESVTREKKLELQVGEQASLAKKMEEERDGWMKKVAEGTASVLQGAKSAGDEANGKGEILVGSSAEMERLRTEISMLQEANRFLRKQIREDSAATLFGNHDHHGWLNAPLARRQTSSPKVDARVEEAKAVLRNIAHLPLGVKPLRIDFGQEKSKMESRPFQRKATAKYQIMMEEARKVKAWEPVRIAGVDMSVID